MARCIVCGKHGLFLKLKSGLCSDCADSKSNDIYSGARCVGSSSQIENEIRILNNIDAAQPIYRKAANYIDEIKKLRSEAAPWKNPFGPGVDLLISTCNHAMAMWPDIERVNRLTQNYAESTLCIFSAAECLIDIYLYRQWYENAFEIIKRLKSFGLKEYNNTMKIDLLYRKISHMQNVSMNYPYSMDECINIIRDRIVVESIHCIYPCSSRQFTRTSFNDMCNCFGLRKNPEYSINAAFQSNPQYESKPHYKYSEKIIDFIIEKIESNSNILADIHEPN